MRPTWEKWGIAIAFAIGGAAGCVSDEVVTADADGGGGPGTVGAECFANGTCNAGLACLSNRCVELGSDASPGTDSSMTADGGTGDGGTGDSSMDAPHDAAVDCGAPPAIVLDGSAPGPYCPFLSGSGGYCQAGQFCCKGPGVADGVCTTSAGGANPCAPTDVAWQCDDSTQCGAGVGGSTCCGTGTIASDPSCGAAYKFASGFTGTKCQASCLVNQLPMCTSTAECVSGTCTPFKAKGGVSSSCQ